MINVYDVECAKRLRDNHQYDELIMYISRFVDVNAKAMMDMALCYYKGQGVQKNYERCFELYKKASDIGNLDALAEVGYNYKWGIGIEKNILYAVELYRKSAEQGNATGQAYLGDCFYFGSGVEEDEKQAVELYRKSAEQGNAIGQWKLGDCYYFGRGVEEDERQAVELYRKSAEQGNAVGQRKLGDCYYFGRGVEEDEKQAVELYRKSAEQGNAIGQQKLGDCYYFGRGVKEDEKQAVELYKQSAEQGDAIGQRKLGDCYYFGRGIEEDKKQAVELYKQSAEQGDAIGQRKLGDCYYFGRGIEEDKKQAVELYKRSAEQGDATGQWKLGNCYEFGIEVEKDEKQAVELYIKSAEQGDAIGQGCLGHCYKNGTGVEKDEKQAVELYQKSAEQGNSKAQIKLAVCYFNGEGVEKNEEKAIELYKKAAEQGEVLAQQILGEIYWSYEWRNTERSLEYYQKVVNNLDAGRFATAFAYHRLGDLYSEDAVGQFKKANEMYIRAVNLYELLVMEEGNREAAYWLGQLYKSGNGVERDDSKAFRYYQYADKEAYLELGECYENGIGTAKSIKKAIKLYKLAVKNENEKAYINLGKCYEDGKGVKKNKNKAVILYKQALSENKHVMASMYLGMCYYHGDGVNKDESKAYELFSEYAGELTIAEYYCKAIEGADSISLYKLGQNHESTFFKNYERAFYFYLLSAKKGYMPAIIKLIRCYQQGRGIKKNSKFAHQVIYKVSKWDRNAKIIFYLGVDSYCGYYGKKDYKKAAIFFKESAIKGDEEAAFFLSLCYKKGIGSAIDIDEEAYWLQRAVDAKCNYAIAFKGVLCLYKDDNKQEGMVLLEELPQDYSFFKVILHYVKVAEEKIECNKKQSAYLLLLEMIEYKFVRNYMDNNIPKVIKMCFAYLMKIGRFEFSKSELTMQQELYNFKQDFIDLLMNNMNIGDKSMKHENINKEFDFFVSHASEDKSSIAEPLVAKLRDKGAKVWYDKNVLKVGDSLRKSIDLGLSQSRYGIVILSEHYFKKFWTGQELNGLFAKQEEGKKVILPIWHNISKDIVKQYSPMLADMLSLKSSDYTIDELAENLIQLL